MLNFLSAGRAIQGDKIMVITKRTKIIWGILLVLLLAFAGLLWTRQTPVPSVPPVPRDVPVKKKAAPAKANKKDNTDKDAAATPDAPADAGTVVAPIVAGNLGRITELRALEEELTLEAKIAKLKKEKEEASRSPSVPTLSLPSLTPPASPSPAPAVPRAASSLMVISVQGVGGKLSATIRTGSGQVVVHKGSRLGEAVVTDISRQAVTIRRGGKTSTLPFE